MTDAGPGESRWLAETGGDRGPSYAARFTELAESGMHVHGEADLVASLAPEGGRVLDAGCGTGRVAIELARRGFDVAGIDLDASMLEVARAAAPELTWISGDLATLPAEQPSYDVVVAAGNVMIFLAPGTEAHVVGRMASRLRPGGILIAGFSLQPGRLALADYDRYCARAGLSRVSRWATWDRQPWTGSPTEDYAVSVHRRQAG
ncbi:MAG TPA: class I SAM-dependent methyltransferase [Mycobacteriales bacterium]|nr:class I SAM-dependent methyltransferase [Mycobacteriales bacterium]